MWSVGGDDMALLACVSLGADARGVAALAFSPGTGALLAVATLDDYRTVALYDWASGAPRRTGATVGGASPSGPGQKLFCLAFVEPSVAGVLRPHPALDGAVALLAGGMTHFRLWRPSEGGSLFPGPPGAFGAGAPSLVLTISRVAPLVEPDDDEAEGTPKPAQIMSYAVLATRDGSLLRLDGSSSVERRARARRRRARRRARLHRG